MKRHRNLLRAQNDWKMFRIDLGVSKFDNDQNSTRLLAENA